jgi:membrane protease YdiL (CAAX protease family)
MSVGNPQYVVLGIFVAYMVVVGVTWKVNEVDYATIGDGADNIRRGIVVPIGLGCVVLSIATTVLGAWHDVLFEDARSGPNWALVVPVLFGLVAVVNCATVDFTNNSVGLPMLALGTLLVGFGEEVASRGLLVVGGREAGWSPTTVYLVSTIAFALLHGMNAFFGQSAKITLAQIVFAFAAGSALYVTRLTTGTLLVGIVLHALWDFGTLGVNSTKRQQKPVAGPLALVVYLGGVVAVWFVI